MKVQYVKSIGAKAWTIRWNRTNMKPNFQLPSLASISNIKKKSAIHPQINFRTLFDKPIPKPFITHIRPSKLDRYSHCLDTISCPRSHFRSSLLFRRSNKWKPIHWSTWSQNENDVAWRTFAGIYVQIWSTHWYQKSPRHNDRGGIRFHQMRQLWLRKRARIW